jgi:hypothetical protein
VTVPAVEIDIDGIAGLRNASDIAQGSELAEPCECCGHGDFPLPQISHIKSNGIGPIAKFRRERFRLIELQIAEHNASAFSHDHAAKRAANTFRAARNKCDLA